jgi:putative SOS response-associated peptidase YedK
MCGRFALTDDEAALMAFLGITDGEPFPPRYNIAPTQPIAIVRHQHGARRFALVRWGLVPSWVENPQQFSLLINARAERIVEKPSFKNAMRYRRCLVPASGFYEWRRHGTAKQPYWLRPRAGGPIAFAGLWETWSDRDGGEIDTACIVTTHANATVAPIHARMPVIVMPENFGRWLTEPDSNEAAGLLQPASDDFLEAFQVSDRVNKADVDDPGLIEPVLEIRASLFDD